MTRRKLLGAVLLALLGLVGAGLESALVHTDDGCVVETHCNACLLQLRSPGVVTTAFAMPRAVFVAQGFVAAPQQPLLDAAPRTSSSRGPPRG